MGLRSYTLAGLLTATALLAWLLWPARRPSVLLISIDSLRPDFLSCYGGRHAQTPHIDAVAAAGVSFTQAIADVPWERASVASVLTGRYATTHHVRSFFDRLPETSATMAERFAAAGYRTGAVVSDFDLDHIFLLDRGFQTYDDRYTVPVHITSHERPVHLASLFYGDVAQDRGFRRRKLMADSLREDAQVTNAAIGWLRRVGLQPFFLWVHYFGPHRRWQSGTELDEVLAAYQPAVQRVDAEIGRLLGVLNEMQLDRNTIIVVHADRGTSLLDHGELSPGTDLYDTSLRVPLIMYWRGRLPAGVRNGAMVRLIDVLPTLTELSGLPPLASPNGRSLVGLLRGSEPTPNAEAYCETYLPATAAASKTASGPDGRPVHFGFVRRGIRTERWKYIRSDPSALIDVGAPAELPESWRPAMMSEELFDLSQDPGEQHNLIDSDPTTAATLRRALDRHVQGRTR